MVAGVTPRRYNTRTRSAELTSPGYALALAVTEHRLALEEARSALRLAVLAPTAGRDPLPYLNAALEALERSVPGRDLRLWALADALAIQAAARPVILTQRRGEKP